MTFYEKSCKNCGGNLVELENGRFKCEYCGSVFTCESVEKHMEELHRLFDEAKREAISNARKNLYDAVNAEYISTTLVHECVMALKQLIPDDFQANFYEIANGNTPRKIAKTIRRLNVKENEGAIDSMVRFLILSLQSEFVTEVGDLIERAYKTSDLVKYEKYSTELSLEAEKIDNCIYMTSYPRDVFVAYSSKDMEKVMELVEYLEEQGLSCFVAARNLRHGRGAVENYEAALREAMDNCQSFVFVSGTNSRHPGCDALKREIPYIKSVDIENSPAELRQDYGAIPHKYKKHRVEYRIEESTRPMAADRAVSEFFNGYERVYSPEEVADRIINRPIEVEEPEVVVTKKVKYCVTCKSETPEDAKFCMNCAGNTFANSLAEVELMQKIAELEKEKAELAKKNEQPIPVPMIKPALAIESAEQLRLDLDVVKPTSTTKSTVEQLQFDFSTVKPISTTQPTEGQLQFDLSTIKKTPITTTKESEGLEFTLNADKRSYSVSEGTCKDRKIVIPSAYNSLPVTSINDKAFFGNPHITSIIIPNSVSNIGRWAFDSCSSLRSITIPSSVISIGDSAFGACSNLESVIIPDGVKHIGDFAFTRCSKLVSITIPNSVTSFGQFTFSDCSSLTSIRISGGMTRIGMGVFGGCSSLTSIIIPKSVSDIGGSAFMNCSNLKNIYYTGTEVKWRRISIEPNNSCLVNATIIYNYVPEE